MTMTREEAEGLVDRFSSAAWGTGYFCLKDRVNLAAATVVRNSLRPQLIDALCADPNAELLKACKRLYDICYVFVVRPVNDLGGDAIIELDPNLCITDLNWAKEVIEAAEEG